MCTSDHVETPRRHIPGPVKVLLIVQSFVIAYLGIWMYENYQNDFYFQAYVNASLQGSGFTIVALSSVGIFSLLSGLRQCVAARQRLHDSCVEQCRNLQRRGDGTLHEAPANTQGAGASNHDRGLNPRRARFQHDSRAPRRTAPDQYDKKGDSR